MLFGTQASDGSQEKASKWKLALHVLFELPSLRLQANVLSYSAAISACETRRSVEGFIERADRVPSRPVLGVPY